VIELSDPGKNYLGFAKSLPQNILTATAITAVSVRVFRQKAYFA
jgi:hypothetical protein